MDLGADTWIRTMSKGLEDHYAIHYTIPALNPLGYNSCSPVSYSSEVTTANFSDATRIDSSEI